MAQKSGFFNSVGGDRKYKAEEFADFFHTIISTGVSPVAGSLAVTANNTMDLVVSAGRAYVEGYYYNNDSDYNIAIDAADAVLNRIDRIILRLDYVNRTIALAVLKGLPGSSPAAPALTRSVDKYELCIAEVLISAAIAGIAQAKVTDKRADSTVCGYMKGVVIFDGNEELATHLADYALKGIYGDNGSGTKAVTNIDTITKSGYYVTANSITIDDKTDWWLINHMHNYSAPGYAFQIASSLQSAESQYARSQINGAWSAWKKLLNKSDYDVLFQYANDGKTGIANAVTAKGVSASPTDTFSVLATKIGQISTGKKVLSGTLTVDGTTHSFSKYGQSATTSLFVANLTYSFGFTPRYAFLFSTMGNSHIIAVTSGNIVYVINSNYNLNNSTFPAYTATLDSTGFHLPVVSGNVEYTWVVVE